MNRKSLYLINGFFLLFCIVLLEIAYLSLQMGVSSDEKEIKRRFAQELHFPDLALSQSTPYIRNRTMSVAFEKYPFMQQFVDTDTQSFALNIKNK